MVIIHGKAMIYLGWKSSTHARIPFLFPWLSYFNQNGNATVMAFKQCLPVSLHNPVVQPGMTEMGLLGWELFLRLHHQTKERKQIIKLSFG